MSSAKRKRQRANRHTGRETDRTFPVVTDADLDQLLADIVVRADCDHASTRTTTDGLVLTRCALGVAVAGGCPRHCASFEKRRVGGIGLGLGSGG